MFRKVMQLNESTRNLSDSVVENEDIFSVGRLRISNVVIMAIGLFCIFIMSFVGNISVFVIFYKRPVLLTISNRFIVNLSVCNILQTVAVMPFVLTSLISQEWWFGSVWCQASGFGMNLIFTASTFTLVLIAIDRYLAVAKPLHYSMTMTSKRASVMIASVWISAILCSLPPLVGWNSYEFQRNKIACMTASYSKHQGDRSYSIFLVTVCFILPSCIIMCAYCVIFKAAKVSSEKVRRNSTIASGINDFPELSLRGGRRNSSVQSLMHMLSCSNKTGSVLWRRDDRKAAVTSFIVLFTFILCWLLYFIIIILECLLKDPDTIDPVVKTLSVVLALSSCAINPLVYVFRCKLQRVELKSILGFKQNSFNRDMSNGNQNGSRRPSYKLNCIRQSPCLSREGSQESEVIEILHHVNTAATLTSMIIPEEEEKLPVTQT
ncbi:G-protein coupled receptor 161-like [Mya arenaria]|uniref:G-protein coupled receptor 161-like n=1 Tax=Mya arenaria TaxID=6604 RepID=UPI0022E37F3A|nr:G-protein coupled receptor 161-like [Mya arenaria]